MASRGSRPRRHGFPPVPIPSRIRRVRRLSRFRIVIRFLARQAVVRKLYHKPVTDAVRIPSQQAVATRGDQSGFQPEAPRQCRLTTADLLNR